MENRRLLALLLVLLHSSGEASQHPCQILSKRVIYNRRCFWIIDGLNNFDQAEQKCIDRLASLANLYSIEHMEMLLEYGRYPDVHKITSTSDGYSAYLGMEYDKSSGDLFNYNGSTSQLESTAWLNGFPLLPVGTQDIPMRKTSLKINLIAPSRDNSGLVDNSRLEIYPNVVCETKALNCEALVVDISTQKLDCAEGALLTTCTISCNPGFVFTDGNTDGITLTCQDDLEWDREIPTCIRGTCPELNFDGQPGNRFCNGNKHGDTCSFFCDSHKQLRGPKTRVCQTDGKWSDMQPTCEDVVCDPIEYPDDYGTMKCTDKSNYGSDCTFYCKSGLQRWGPKEVTCLWNGEWSDGYPSCKKYDPKCPNAHKHGMSCPDTNCQINDDCNDEDKICCPTKCGTAVCWTKPKRTFPKELLYLFLLGGIGGNRCSTTNCLVNACQVTSCPSNLGAQCRTTCNGCQANFVDFKRDITRQCRCPTRYPPFPGCSQQQCSQYRCITNNQQSTYYYTSQYYNPNLQCRMSSCGGCFPQFYNRFGRRVNCRQIIQLVPNPVVSQTIGG